MESHKYILFAALASGYNNKTIGIDAPPYKLGRLHWMRNKYARLFHSFDISFQLRLYS